MSSSWSQFETGCELERQKKSKVQIYAYALTEITEDYMKMTENTKRTRLLKAQKLFQVILDNQNSSSKSSPM